MLDLASLRARLLGFAAVTIGTALVVVGLSITIIFEHYYLERIAEELDARWHELAGLVILDDSGRASLEHEPSDPRYGQPLSGAFWQIEESGAAALRSRSLWDRSIDTGPGRPEDAAFEIAGFEPESELYIVARSVTLEDATGPRVLRLVVALDHAEVEAAAGDFASDLAIALSAMALVLFAGAGLQVSLGLSPLNALRAAVQAVRAGSARRLSGGFPTELQPLVDDLDRLLDRNEALVARARDRAGMLAHGFKTPLTILALEAARLEQAGAGASAGVIREQAEQMRRLVERELARARVRGGVASASALGADATTLLAPRLVRLVDLVRRMPHADDLAFTLDVPGRIAIRMDADDFSEVVGNLLDNARKHARSEVCVIARPTEGMAIVEIADDGPGFGPPAEGPMAAEGAGLGLAIVDDVLAAYGARLERAREAGRTVLRFRIPVAGPASRAPAE